MKMQSEISTEPSTRSRNNRTDGYLLAGTGLLLILALIGLCAGKYPLSPEALVSGDEYQLKIFYNLRLGRVITGVFGGFALGIAGYIFQIVFHNPLASPDIIGVASGASAGAAFGILFFGPAFAVSACAFAGALTAVVSAILLSMLDRAGQKGTIILSGVVVHALAQTVLMYLKIAADPERELASIEYWIMGSLNAVSTMSIRFHLPVALGCVGIAILFHRQLLLLSADETEAAMLGVNVNMMRFFILITATLMVSAVVSLTGLISFIGLIAPHCARLLTKRNDTKTMLLCGLIGGSVLCLADIFARSIAHTELPVSIFTSLIGAPFLITLVYSAHR